MPFEHDLPLFLAWSHIEHLAITTLLSFTTTQCQQAGFTKRTDVRGRKSGLVTSGASVIGKL